MALTTLNNRSINRSDTASSGQKWTATSATATDFQAGGKILQIVNSQINTGTSITSLTEVTTNITKAITPSATSSKILVFINGVFSMNVSRATTFCGVALKRTIGATTTNLQGGASNDFLANNVFGASNMQMVGNFTVNYLDSPSTTDATTYTLNARVETSGESIRFNNGGMGSNITLMEIAG